MTQPGLWVCEWADGTKEFIDCINERESRLFQLLLALVWSHGLRQMVQAGVELQQNGNEYVLNKQFLVFIINHSLQYYCNS